MQNKKNIFSLFLVMIVLILCTGQVMASTQFISIATGSTGGTYYPVGVILATNFQEDITGDYKFSAQASGGSRENLEMLRNKEVKLAIAGGAPSSNAYSGKEKYEGKAIENIRYVTALWPEAMQIVYRTGIGIESFKDFPGRKIAVGPAGGGGSVYFPILLQQIEGLSFDDFQPQFLGYTDSAQAMQNRLIDACFLGGGFPTSAVSQLYASQVSVDMIEFSDDDVAAVRDAAPYFARVVIEKGTYPGQEEDLDLMGIKSTLVVEESVSEELVYEMLKSIYDKDLAGLKKKHGALKTLSLEEALNGLTSVPLHPGALKFYQEHNIDIPADLMGQ
mgnify:CR=1 FL=1